MHRRHVMCNGGYQFHPSSHCGIHLYPPYELAQPMIRPVANFHHSPCSCYHGHSCCEPLPQMVSPTIIQNDLSYRLENEDIIEESDEYVYPYRVIRRKVPVEPILPKFRVRREFQPTVMTTSSERVLLPRSTMIRHSSIPSYPRTKPVRLMPIYRSTESPYLVSDRGRRTIIKENLPIRTVYRPSRRIIQLRSLSP